MNTNPPERACTWRYGLYFAWQMLWLMSLGLVLVIGAPVVGLLVISTLGSQ